MRPGVSRPTLRATLDDLIAEGWVLGDGPHRFGELRRQLPGITPRALTLSLKDLQDDRLVRREVLAAYPPVTSYSLDRHARPVYRALVPLATAI